MHVSKFMVPADKVFSCNPTSSLRQALDLMVKNKVGSIVVRNADASPAGIVTKTDMLEAYQNDFTLDDHTVCDVMKTSLVTVKDTMNRDQAAKAMEKNNLHHAIVTDKNGTFVGLISAWDITAEVARDSRAWPWNRSDDGKFHNPHAKAVVQECPLSPRSPVCVQEQLHPGESEPKKRSSFVQMIDALDMQPDM